MLQKPFSKTAPAAFAAQAVLRPIASLKAHPRNARTHSPKQIRQIADSIRAFGFVNPVLIDGDGGVIAGHGRLEAARTLGMAKVPTLRIDWLSEAEKRAYVIADNRLAEKAGWDRDLLALELGEIGALDIDVTLTGFDMREIELILDSQTGSAGEEGAFVPQAGPAVTMPGDLWQLGRHRLLCGNALERTSYARLLGRRRVQLVVADPPYNVPISGHVSGLGRVKHREFLEASGEMNEAAFTRFLTEAMRQMARASAEGSLHYVCMDWRHMFELLSAGRAVYDAYLNLCVWAKSNAGMGSLYRSQHELVVVFKKGARPHINNVELGKNGRYRTNLWSYPGGSSFSATRAEELAWHPTVKPQALIADILLDASNRDDLVLDPFAGSGTTLVAAEQTGRTARVIEVDPLYCDVIIRRFEAAAGIAAVHADTGRRFAEITDRRATETAPEPGAPPPSSRRRRASDRHKASPATEGRYHG